MSINLPIFIAFIFLITLTVGAVLRKVRIPWIFSALLLGAALSIHNPFSDITNGQAFNFFAQMGMYFMLFIIGFEINPKEIIKQKTFIIGSSFLIVLAEALTGSLVLHKFFVVSWPIAVLTATSFATVGESVLLPILEEFKLLRVKLGQTILGIGVADDIIEIVTIVLASIAISLKTGKTSIEISSYLMIILALFGLTFLLTKLKKPARKLSYYQFDYFFLFVMFLVFVFIGIGQMVSAASLGALLAGISMRNFLPKHRLAALESEIRTLAYGFFAPIFFVWVGLDADMHVLVKFPLLVLLVVSVANLTKILASYVVGHKRFGADGSLIMGIGLSVRFSSSIVIVRLLFDNALIDAKLYSVLIGATIIFKFVIPPLLSYLIPRWQLAHPEQAAGE